jgi:hypothetical protein
MSDTREKLVELLDIIIQPGQKTLGDIADHLIANGVTVQKWIPVSERLPEHGEVVLCYMSFKEARALQWDNASRYWLGYESGDDWSKANVTHWMPLPEPPKEVIDIEKIEVE